MVVVVSCCFVRSDGRARKPAGPGADRSVGVTPVRSPHGTASDSYYLLRTLRLFEPRRECGS